MTGLLKIYPTSKDYNSIQKTLISAINSALASNVSTESSQGLQADVLRTHQLIEQQKQFISSLDKTLYNLSNVVVTGFDLGSQSDTDSTSSLNSIKEFVRSFAIF